MPAATTQPTIASSSRTAPRKKASAPVTSVYAVGAGGNLIWVDRDLGLTVVARWLDDAAADGFMARILAALD